MCHFGVGHESRNVDVLICQLYINVIFGVGHESRNIDVSPVSLAISGCDQPNVTVLTYHGTTAPHLAVGLSPSPVPLSGIRCLTTLEMPAVLKRPSNRC